MPKKNSTWAKLKQWVRQEHRVLITSSAVGGSIILLRLGGVLQSWELATFDQLFKLSPPVPRDERITIVGIDEIDTRRSGQGITSDRDVTRLLKKINSFQPRAIGLDIYRDLPVEPGTDEFVKIGRSLPNLIGIERLGDANLEGVLPPPVLSKQNQVGFNNVVIDVDGKVRRSILYWHVEGQAHKSFALQLALRYLDPEGITPKKAAINPEYMQLGKSVFKPFKSNDGGYVNADDFGYQFLGKFRKHSQFDTVPMRDVLSGRVKPKMMRDRIVLIGSTASSLEDLFYTPHPGSFLKADERLFGVELQAYFISQILSASLEGQALINSWSDPIEGLWIWLWSGIGASLCWRLRSPRKSVLSIVAAGSGLMGIGYLSFIFNYWIPLVPPLLGMLGSAVVITSHLAHREEELKRSKEFLHKVIDTIADPIFVKDKQHRWIILNQAYSQFVGYPIEALLQKSEHDVFSQEEAEAFWQQDELVFNSGEQQENEEKFTDAQGNTYLIATKRSLHKDAAGNLFLVGVIRDITERKRIEEDLKRTTAELMRSNAELRLSEDRLRDLAYHDALTGLPNRKQFYERLGQSVELAENDNQMLALLFLDLDGFKEVNDTFGHDMGDRLLKIVATRLKACLRGSDTVCRLGGDEFTVILPIIPQMETAAVVAEKILATLSKAFVLKEHSVFVTVSVGIALYPLHATTVDALIKNADTAMYKAKELGRNQYQFY